MQNIQVTTPQNVSVNIPLAGAGWRILSFLIDFLVILIYVFGVSYAYFNFADRIYSNPFDSIGNEYQTFVFVVHSILMLPAVFYSLWTEMVFNGQSLGKLICGLKVVKLFGYKAGFLEYFTRWLFRLFDIWTFVVVLFYLSILSGLIEDDAIVALTSISLIGTGFMAIILIMSSKKSQRLGDMIAGTTVVRLRGERKKLSSTILWELSGNYEPTYPEVTRLTDNDARIIHDAYKTAKANKDYRTIQKLRERLTEVLGIQPKSDDMDFISTVMRDFNYYTRQ